VPVAISLSLGLVLGVASGGSIGRLAVVRLRYPYVLLSVFVLQGVARGRIGVSGAGQWSVLAWGAASMLLIVVLLMQREHSTLVLVAVGISLNLLVVLLNGFMPVYPGAGISPMAVGEGLSAAKDFYAVGTPQTLALVLADSLPLPLVGSLYLLSVGDVLLICGVSGFLVSAATTPPAPTN